MNANDDIDTVVDDNGVLYDNDYANNHVPQKTLITTTPVLTPSVVSDVHRPSLECKDSVTIDSAISKTNHACVNSDTDEEQQSSRPTRAQAKRIAKITRQLFPEVKTDTVQIEQLLIEAYESTSDEYGEAEALEWADGFQFPADVASRDMMDLDRHGGDLEAMVRERHDIMSSKGRLSIESVEAFVAEDDPDRQALLELVHGIPIVVSDDFVPNNAPAKLRSKYVRLAPCVNKLMYDLFISKG